MGVDVVSDNYLANREGKYKYEASDYLSNMHRYETAYISRRKDLSRDISYEERSGSKKMFPWVKSSKSRFY